MSAAASYARNDELFVAFYAQQRRLAGHLAGHPELVSAWLGAQPRRVGEQAESVGVSKAWRTARLSVARRRELAALIERVETLGAPRLCSLDASCDAANFRSAQSATENLAAWLLASMPVRSYFEMADFARPSLAVFDPAADGCHRELVLMRETLFLTNYGLARMAALNPRHPDYGDRLSAASCGLLDAIDRFVPGPRAARFSYFASYWVRYHLSRQTQKHSSLISYPINQHRISRRIDRCLAERRSSGRPEPSEAEVCAELQVGEDALYWHRQRPRVTSLQRPLGSDPGSQTMEQVLFDPSPEPAVALDEREAACHLHGLLRVHAAPAARVMLAYARGVGLLPEAAEDYLAELHQVARERIRHQANRLRLRGSEVAGLTTAARRSAATSDRSTVSSDRLVVT